MKTKKSTLTTYMRTLFIFFSILSLTSYSQTKLDFGDVIGRDISTCNSKSDGKICASKNEFEIYLTRAWLMLGNYETVKLQYNNTKWKATLYEGDWIRDTVAKFSLKPVTSFDQIFAELKKNSTFTLPDQKDLKYDDRVDDGTDYSLSFKTGNIFRNYEFRNPDICLLYNKEIKEFQYYVNIVSLLFEQLRKYKSCYTSYPTTDTSHFTP